MDDADSSPADTSRLRRFGSELLEEPGTAHGRSPLAVGRRSPFSFYEESESSSPPANSPPANFPEQQFGFGIDPPATGDTGEYSYLETESEPFRFWDDAKALPGIFWADAKSLVTWQNAIILGAAAGGAVVIRDDVDHKVRQETAEHPLRWGEGSEVLRQFGEFSYQVPFLAGVYAASLWTQDETLHEFSSATICAYGLTAISTVTIKGITDTHRPTTEFQNGDYGFPSYHSASSFCIAACLDEYYGWKVGVPAYILAGLVGWSRIDQREHDLSDVLFGAVLGVVIGKTVSAAHLDRQSDLRISPYYDFPNQATGIAVEKRF